MDKFIVKMWLSDYRDKVLYLRYAPDEEHPTLDPVRKYAKEFTLPELEKLSLYSMNNYMYKDTLNESYFPQHYGSVIVISTERVNSNIQ